MVNYLVPKIDRRHVAPMLWVSILGAVCAGFYGALHNQISYTISEEYFTKLKYLQFHYAIIEGHNRLSVAVIGFLATWWVGLFAGWFLSRWYMPHCSISDAYSKVFRSSICIFVVSVLFMLAAGMVGYRLGPSADFSAWLGVTQVYDIGDVRSFVRVAYIHNASYLGAMLGLALAMVFIKR